LNGAVSKTVVRVTPVPRVRIPPPPLSRPRVADLSYFVTERRNHSLALRVRLPPWPLSVNRGTRSLPPPGPASARLTVRPASRARVPLAEAEPTRCLSRCGRSPTRSPSSSSTFHLSQAHRVPRREWGPVGQPREHAAHDLRRRSVAPGCLRPRRHPGCVHRARDGSRSGRSEIGLPTDCRRRPRRRTPRCFPLSPVPAPARSRRCPREPGLGARSGRGRTPDAAGSVPRAPRIRDRRA
jgi:hypothetical protein